MNTPNLGRGEVPTPEEIVMMKKTKQVNLAIQFMGPMLSNLPQIEETRVEDLTYTTRRNMTPVEVFEYSMDLVTHIELFLDHEPARKIFS